MTRALYLHGRDPIRVALDGPALRIEAKERAAQLFPLARVSRVVVMGDVSWVTEALLACADRGVAVSFLDRKERLRARCHGPLKTSVLDWNTLLERFLEQEGAPELYLGWVRAQEQVARIRVFKHLPARWYDGKESTLRRLLDEYSLRFARRADLRWLDRYLLGLTKALVADLTREAGIDVDLPALRIHRLDLIANLADILHWDLQRDKMRFLKWRKRIAGRQGKPYGNLGREPATRFFEHYSDDIRARCHSLLSRLYHVLYDGTENHGA